MLDKATAREVASKYSKEVIELICPDKIVLFGSFVNGGAHDGSDIDLAIIVSGMDYETWYDTRIMLQRIRRNKLYLAVEPHLLDASRDPSGFVKHVVETGDTIYQGAPRAGN